MYGGSSKLGRGGGRGGGRHRNSFPMPPHRPTTTTTGRLSIGGSSSSASRQRPTAASSSATPQTAEETFSLVSGMNPQSFAMIMKLTPDLVDEIRRLEDQGGTARMKFDPVLHNTTGNVIDVGGKEFKFTWAREVGDLCDIYEERQRGEEGNGLLVESGCAWRKVNVQRILDESIKKQVKKRSEEAEHKTNQRKAIVLDPANPTIKQLAANEVRTSSYKQRREAPLKKRRFDPPQVTGPPKSANKPMSNSVAAAKVRSTASPAPSPPEQSKSPASPSDTGNIKYLANENVTPIRAKIRDAAAILVKESSTKGSGAAVETPLPKSNFGHKTMDLESLLVSLLKETPMNMQDLEKALGDANPNSARKIAPILKKIAIFRSPGKYFLKTAVESESSKRPLGEKDSSPENSHQERPKEENYEPLNPVRCYVEKISIGELEDEALVGSKPLQESSPPENIGIHQHSHDFLDDKKVDGNSERPAGSSSGSGSESDSDSDSSASESDSESHGKGRSRSPVGSRSGSSTDSDSEVSTNSKEGPDEDVDIMTSDDDIHPKQTSELGFAGLPIIGQAHEGMILNGADEKDNGDGSDDVDIEGHDSDAVDVVDHESGELHFDKDLPDDGHEAEVAVNIDRAHCLNGNKSLVGTKQISSDQDEFQERQNFIGKLFDDSENINKDSFRHEQSDSSEKISKAKAKRERDKKHFDEKYQRTKRLKAESSTQPAMPQSKNARFSDSMLDSSPNRLEEDPYKGTASQQMNQVNREGYTDFGLHRGDDQSFPGKSDSELRQSGQKKFDQSSRAKARATMEVSNKHIDSSGTGLYMPNCLPVQKEKASRDTRRDNPTLEDKKAPRHQKDAGAGETRSMSSDLHHKKYAENAGKSKEVRNFPNSVIESSPKEISRTSLDRYPVNGRGSLLQRDTQDLELGEFREPSFGEIQGKKQFEKKNPLKHLEHKSSTSENHKSDLDKGKLFGKSTSDTGKPLSPNTSAGKRIPECHTEDLTGPNARIVHSQPQHHLKTDHSNIGSQYNKFSQSENATRQGGSIEGYGESNRKVPTSSAQKHDPKRAPTSCSVKESRTNTLHTMGNLSNGQKDTSLTEGSNGIRRKSDFSVDEDSSYLKYDKDEAELKGPIKDVSQYDDYVQEYREKYDSYCSLNKIIENYRKEFEKMGKDLDAAQDRDRERYNKILGQLRDSYRQCGPRHKKLKKIFVVLHEELQNIKLRLKEYAASHAKKIR